MNVLVTTTKDKSTSAVSELALDCARQDQSHPSGCTTRTCYFQPVGLGFHPQGGDIDRNLKRISRVETLEREKET